MDTQPSIRMELFGPIRILIGAEALPRMRSRKGVWLLALLGLRCNRAVDRDWLAGTLWPESDRPQALYNLRENLHELRGALGTSAGRLSAPDRDSLHLTLHTEEADFLRFDSLIGREDDEGKREGVALYRRPLMEGCNEIWAVDERDSRAVAWAEAVEGLASRDLAGGHFRAAANVLRPLVRLDSLRESAHRLLIEALAGSGNQAEATRVFRSLQSQLHRELNVAPCRETRELYERVCKNAIRSPVKTKGPVRSERRPLPRCLTKFVGREQECGAIRGLLDTHRLVTVTGSGGIGKTRLAIRIADDLANELADGVWWVGLDQTSEPRLVPEAGVSALGIPPSAIRSALDSAVAFLEDREGLIVLDNCEHVIEEAAFFAEAVLQRCPSIRILATSRQRLGILGEHCFRCPSLGLPMPKFGIRPESPNSDSSSKQDGRPGQRSCDPALFDGVRFFLDRARESSPGFELNERNESRVLALLNQLDGIPLSIELAAAHLQTLSLDDVMVRLHDRLRTPAYRNRNVAPRHQDLNELVDWSYKLLEPHEQEMFAMLATFHGGWSKDACEALWSGGGSSEQQAEQLLFSLVDKSLVSVDIQDSGTRYRMLESIRLYALELLKRSDVAPRAKEAHLTWYSRLSEEAYSADRGPEQAKWQKRVEEESGNFRAAFEWSLGEGRRPEAALQIAGNLGMYWFRLGKYSEALDLLRTAQGAASNSSDTALHRALYASGWLSHLLEDKVGARAAFERLAELSRDSGDLVTQSRASFGLCNIADRNGDHSTALAQSKVCLLLAKQAQDMAAQASAIANIAHAQSRLGLYDDARDNLTKAIAINNEIRLDRAKANCLHVVGWSYHRQDQFGSASQSYEAALQICRQVGCVYGVMESLFEYGELAATTGLLELGRSHLAEALELSRNLGLEKWEYIILSRQARFSTDCGIATGSHGSLANATAYFARDDDWGNLSQCCLSMVHLNRGDPMSAAVLLSLSKRFRRCGSEVVHPHDESVWQSTESKIRLSLSEDQIRSGVEFALSLSLPEAKQHALQAALLPAGASMGQRSCVD